MPESATSRRRAAASQPPPEFLTSLSAVRRPVVVGHVEPDADSIGACLGLSLLMRQHEIDARFVLPRPVASRLRFLVELGRDVPVVSEPPSDAEAAIICDTATPRRVHCTGGFERLSGLATFNIDHHITNPDYARHNWVDPHASSTSELIVRLAAGLRWKPSGAAASLLYAGLHGDTGGFSLPNATADALHLAAELVRAGADVAHIGEQLCRSLGRPDFELLRRVYDHTRMTDDGRIAYSVLSHEDIVASGCSASDIDDQVSIPRALRGIRMAMLFSEGEPGIVRVNLRGEGRTSVIEIAEQFGGGGHTQSAGVRMKNKPIHEVVELVLAAAQAHLARSD